MTGQTDVTLNDGIKIPQLGLGTFKLSDAEVTGVVLEAFRLGYRHIDTAASYENERGVGRAVAQSGLAREEIFVTSKLRNGEHGFDETLRAFDGTMERLGLDMLDLYLIHWPSPRVGRYAESWKAFIRLKEEGRIRSIGVSNFYPEHLERIIGETGWCPRSTRSSCIPISSGASCGRFMTRKISPSKAGARWGGGICSMIR